MGRNSSCVKQNLRKGLWSPEEDEKLYTYIIRFGVSCWSSLPKLAGIVDHIVIFVTFARCGKSCRLRWINYLRPDLKRGIFSQEEEDLIITLHQVLGNSYPNDIKNLWNSSLKKKLTKQGIDPTTHKPITDIEVKEAKDSSTVSTFTITQEPTFLANDSSYYSNNGLAEAYDPFSFFEFQAGANHQSRCNPNLLSQYQSQFAFFDHQGILLNEAKESSCNNSGFQTSNMFENASAAFSWDAENELSSMFHQFDQVNGFIKSEEMTPSSWHELDFSNHIPLMSLSEDLTATNFDVFHNI
nr:MYB protein [Zanthoxylum bungeanum]